MRSNKSRTSVNIGSFLRSFELIFISVNDSTGDQSEASKPSWHEVSSEELELEPETCLMDEALLAIGKQGSIHYKLTELD